MRDENGADMLEVSRLTVRYGPFLAVDDLEISVAPGEIVGVVGPNGAGKSTIVKAIGGLVRPQQGRTRPDRSSGRTRPARRIGVSVANTDLGTVPDQRCTVPP